MSIQASMGANRSMASAVESGSRQRARRLASTFTCGLFLLQLAWIASLPGFRGIDEWDHTYRAEAVAAGEFYSNEPATQGRGDLVKVRLSVVEAATFICEQYTYVGKQNCEPTQTSDRGTVAASGAAQYNPAFYLVTGTAGQFTSGSAVVFVQRLTAALMCAALIWLAAFALCLTSRPHLGLMALIVAHTPIVVYSQNLGAPNGLEISAGLALAACLSSLAALLRNPEAGVGQRDIPLLMNLAALSACVLAVPRLLGPGFVALVGVSGLLLIGGDGLRQLWRHHSRRLLALTSLVTACVLFGGLWSLLAQPNRVADDAILDLSDPVKGTLAEIPKWIFQTVAAFPTRNEPGPPVVYALVFAAIIISIVVALSRSATPRAWWWASFFVGNSVMVIFAVIVTIPDYPTAGILWQGRYGLPFAATLPIFLFAYADRYRVRAIDRRFVALVGVLMTAGHTMSVVGVLAINESGVPIDSGPMWHPPSLVVLALFMTAAGIMMTWAAMQTTGPVLLGPGGATVSPGGAADRNNHGSTSPPTEQASSRVPAGLQ